MIAERLRTGRSGRRALEDTPAHFILFFVFFTLIYRLTSSGRDGVMSFMPDFLQWERIVVPLVPGIPVHGSQLYGALALLSFCGMISLRWLPRIFFPAMALVLLMKIGLSYSSVNVLSPIIFGFFIALSIQSWSRLPLREIVAGYMAGVYFFSVAAKLSGDYLSTLEISQHYVRLGFRTTTTLFENPSIAALMSVCGVLLEAGAVFVASSNEKVRRFGVTCSCLFHGLVGATITLGVPILAFIITLHSLWLKPRRGHSFLVRFWIVYAAFALPLFFISGSLISERIMQAQSLVLTFIALCFLVRGETAPSSRSSLATFTAGFSGPLVMFLCGLLWQLPSPLGFTQYAGHGSGAQAYAIKLSPGHERALSWFRGRWDMGLVRSPAGTLVYLPKSWMREAVWAYSCLRDPALRADFFSIPFVEMRKRSVAGGDNLALPEGVQLKERSCGV